MQHLKQNTPKSSLRRLRGLPLALTTLWMASGCAILNRQAPKACNDNTWHRANLTHYVSYPEPGSPECVEYNGCTWAGQFAFVQGQQTPEWVQSHNIIAIHSKHGHQYRLKTLRIRQGEHVIDAVVYDVCSDKDCNGCCTRNANENGIGFLIDMEIHTLQRFGGSDGVVEWQCVEEEDVE
ncbi:hypothetical protein LX69_00234 [Breznakibacter xylanolyticus]|uniref:Lipoprotein n=1 Tax=Breznakibacter xylanolyticus TaxID=990 RepID=A0A2W7QFU0_9BACT|nr:hypothetical protein [Breznakibacter xylanolyticus]PZX20809.1 hypothetical protein LX69_00234 [Breznakibacter xylanolyticus]